MERAGEIEERAIGGEGGVEISGLVDGMLLLIDDDPADFVFFTFVSEGDGVIGGLPFDAVDFDFDGGGEDVEGVPQLAVETGIEMLTDEEVEGEGTGEEADGKGREEEEGDAIDESHNQSCSAESELRTYPRLRRV